MAYYIFLSICFIVNGIGKAVSDSMIVGHWEATIFSKYKGFFGRNDGASKYKDGDPLKGDRFFLSSTLLVFLTDAWHLFNLVQKISIVGIIHICLSMPIDAKMIPFIIIAYLAIPTFVFHIFYSYIFKKKLNE